MFIREGFRLKKEFRILFRIVFLCILIWIIYLIFPKKNMAFGIKMPKNYSVHGIDVSKYQGKIDWVKISKLKSGKDSIKIDFAIIKATEGRTLVDKCFDFNWKQSKKAGIMRGAYHYFSPNRDVSDQVKNFTKRVKLTSGDLPPVLDIEEPGRFGVDKLRTNVKTWLTSIEKHYGMKPILYTYIDFYEKYLNTDDFKDYPLWIAHYYKAKPITNEKWFFWQHSDKGIIDGIMNNIDFNVFYGNLSELKNMCKK